MPDWRPIRDLHILNWRPTCPTETDMPDRRPIRLHAPPETDMQDRKPIGDQHAPLETNMPVESNRNINTYIFKYTYFHILFAYLYT